MMVEGRRERGLSSSQIKGKAGLAAITILIGPHLFALRGVGSGRQECASWHWDHLHPKWILLSATHNLYISICSLSLLFTPSRLGSASTSFLHLPPSFSFSLCVPSCIPGILLSFLLSLLSISASSSASPPCLSLSISLYLYPLPCLHSPVSSHSLYNRLWEDALHSCVFIRLAHRCPALPALLLLACHSRLHIDLQIHTHSLYTLLTYTPRPPFCQSQHDVMLITCMQWYCWIETNMAPYFM